jgi:superfamily II DNA or RNA helicase
MYICQQKLAMTYTRDEIQEKAKDYSLKHNSLLLQWPTGCGKGRGAMECILASRSNKKWLIVVPEIVQIENWRQDAIKWGLEAKLAPLIEEVICYASFKKYEGRALNCLLNEVQHLSEERARILDTIEYSQIIMDSATVPKEVKDRLPAHYTYKISMKEAVEWGILPAPEVNIHYIELDDWQKIWPKKLKSGKILMVSAKSYYSDLTANFKYWQARHRLEEEPWQQKRMFMAAISRKRWMSEYKTEKAKEVIELIRDKRHVVFCGSVKQAKELGGKQAIHSKNKHNQELIDEFNALESNSLYACSMMKEGMNLEDIEAGLITQLDAGDLGNIQRLGRLLRSQYPELHLICLQGTKDEEYLENFLKAIK